MKDGTHWEPFTVAILKARERFFHNARECIKRIRIDSPFTA